MQHIKHLATRPQPTGASGSTTRPSPGPPPISAKWIETLFARFAAIWPTAWADAVGCVNRDALVNEWSIGLAGLTGEQIGHGVNRARVECRWPPSIAEFRTLAIDEATAEQRAMATRLRAADDGPAPITDGTWADRRAAGQRHLRNLRAALRRRTAGDDADQFHATTAEID